jgi:hypothetical protein
MTSRFKILMVCLGAIMALSAAGVGVAQAARPRQPYFIHNSGETLQSNISIEDSSQQSRLWNKELGTVIRCEKDISEGTLGPQGVDNGRINYKECKIFTIKENSDKQFEEGEELVSCAVLGGEITTQTVKSHLVWAKGENKIRELFSPQMGALFVTISIRNGTTKCPLGEKLELEVTGSVLGQVWRWRTGPAFEEAIMGYVTFDVKNENADVRQLDREWEVKQEPGGALESGTAELKINNKPSALESIEQVELQRNLVTNRRELWGVTE